MRKVIAVTSAVSELGQAACESLALAGHTVFAALSEPDGRNSRLAKRFETFAKVRDVNLRVLELDPSSDQSVASAIAAIVSDTNRLDVVVHSERQIVFGPLEAFTPDQLSSFYDISVASTQRINRAALPQLRKQGEGLLIWISSSCANGAVIPFQGCYASIRASIDVLALSYASELARWGIETSIVVANALGLDHYFRSGRPSDKATLEEYAEGSIADIDELARCGLEALGSRDTDVEAVATAITDLVNMAFGARPLRVHFGPDDDGAVLISALRDRIRADLLRRIGLEGLFKPTMAP